VYDRKWRKVRARVLQGSQVCWICGKALDFDAPARSPQSPSVDHIFPIKAMRAMDERTRDELRLDVSHLRPVHVSCNSRRGAGRRRQTHTSRTWE
jgi:hypothetical protein